jgi:hypothetical protein
MWILPHFVQKIGLGQQTSWEYHMQVFWIYFSTTTSIYFNKSSLEVLIDNVIRVREQLQIISRNLAESNEVSAHRRPHGRRIQTAYLHLHYPTTSHRIGNKSRAEHRRDKKLNAQGHIP